ncbi:MAG TPA: hypothetical protein VMZ29_00240 [Candidatus Bathyarchaeia archaeon]|nr:hypothetical protein [Candidatus Bathyarchaeia archaeon]
MTLTNLCLLKKSIFKNDISYIDFQIKIKDSLKKSNLCFQPFVKAHLDIKERYNFRLFRFGRRDHTLTSIFSKHVLLATLRTLLKGNDVCEFAIHLPLDELRD